MKAFLKKITAWTWAVILLFAVFFTVGLCTLGDVSTTGKSLSLQKGKTAYYSLTTDTNEKLDFVYVKLDTYYASKGEAVQITLNTTSTSNPSTDSNFLSSNAVYTTLSNVSGGGAVEQAKLHNWIALGSGLNRTAKTILISTNASIVIQEIVCLNENGELIEMQGYRPSSASGAISVSELTPAYDAQNSFTQSESAYYNFTAEESYYLNAVKNLLAGKQHVTDGSYSIDGNFNYLATVLFAPSVAIFGGSVFSMRLPAFLATCVLLIFAYLFVRSFTKDERYPFIFAVLLCVGGMLTTVGRMGAPYAFVGSALTASGYFMYQFFAKGISSAKVYKSGLNVLFSGIFAAFAMAIDLASVFPVAAILVLFAFGLRRQKLAYIIALKKTVGTEKEGETTQNGKAVAAVKAKYAEKQRVAWGFAALSFVMASIVLVLISSILCYSAAVRANGEDVGIVLHVWRGLTRSVRSGAAVPFGKANQSNVWAWWLPIKAATIYTGANGVAGKYLAWNVAPSLPVSVLSTAAVFGVTVKVAFDIAKSKKDKKSLRLRRTYFILLVGLAGAMLGGCLKTYVTPVYSLFFHVLQVAFVPLAATMLLGVELSKTKKILLEIAEWLIVAACVFYFIVAGHSMYGMAISQRYTKIFGWTSFINNGYFR